MASEMRFYSQVGMASLNFARNPRVVGVERVTTKGILVRDGTLGIGITFRIKREKQSLKG
jgi:hypothetical protein